MHVIMAVGAEVLPVGAIRRVVVVVTVPMVDGEQMGVALIELPGAPGTDETVQAE
jgi:hypothetical protein